MLSSIFDPASYAFNACAVPTLATAGAMLLFGVVVLFRERGSREAAQFAVLAGTISLWLTCLLDSSGPRRQFWASPRPRTPPNS